MTDPQLDAAEKAFRAAYFDPGLLRHALRKALEAAEKAAWQTIESAPTDEPVLVYGGEATYPITASWSGMNDEPWRLDALGDIHQEIEAPTHWRPLPAPPESAS